MDIEQYDDLSKLLLIQFYLMCEEAIEQSEITSELKDNSADAAAC